MYRILLLTATLILSFSSFAQTDELQRLKDLLKAHPQEDTFRVNRLLEILELRGGIVSEDDLDKYSTEAITLSGKLGYSKGEAYGLMNRARLKILTGKTAEALVLVKKADSIAEKLNDNYMKAMVQIRYSGAYSNLNNNEAIAHALLADSLAAIVNDNQLRVRTKMTIAELYYVTSDYAKALQYDNDVLKILEKFDCGQCLANVWNNFSNVYIALGQYDKSTAYLNRIIDLNKKLTPARNQNVNVANSIGENYRLTGKYAEAMIYYRQVLNETTDAYMMETAESNMADVYVRMDSLPLAFEYAFRSMEGSKKIEDQVGVAWIDGILARAYLKKNMPDSALFYAKHGLETARQIGVVEYLRDNAKALADAYVVKKNYEQAYQYQNLYINYRDSMINSEVKNKIAVLEYNTELEKKQGEISVLSQQKKAQQNFLIAVSVVLLSILITAIALLRNNRQKQKAYAKLEAAQAQLVQSEKMASLGELTAGIAHEIQNPLNFVNNFSEVNNELIEEVKIQNKKIKNQHYPEIDDLLNDIFSNNEKIAHHGRRADSIVKGMLQHSRNTAGQKELTDINNLADEYLRLSYHGYRAKDTQQSAKKAFNATLKTDFDSSIGRINIIPQDIGRVLLNLFNNAFYAVNEKGNRIESGYEPTVSVSTKKTGNKIELKVSDNGNGIPQAVINKIFQPFFTTKPAGEGTGLGLSLAYDTITKGHGGEMKVETKEGEGTVFTIVLPV